MLLPRTLLVAADLGPHSARVLDTALALADALDARVHLLHAFTLSELSESTLRSEGLAGAHDALQRQLRELASAHRESARIGEVLVREGDPAQLIAKTAEQLSADLIVVDSYHHGMQRLARGSVAEALTRSAPCAVYVLHGKQD